MEVGYTCPDETLLQWQPVPGASEYQVYRLGATHLEPWLQHHRHHPGAQPGPDAGALLRRGSHRAGPTAGRPAIPSTTPRRARAATSALFSCGSWSTKPCASTWSWAACYRLRSATLERLVNGSYQAVQTISPPTQRFLLFTDLPPVSDRYLYRVRLDTQAGQAIYSQVEEAYRVRPGNVLAFPNPVLPGEVLSLIGSSGAILSVRLYDTLGRFVRETSGEGVINEINTTGLRKGLYLLRVSSEGQPAQTVRVVVLE